MPENSEAPANADWLVGIPGREHELPIRAAYIATNTADAKDLTGSARVTLKDAEHKIVFQAPAGAVLYVRRDHYAAASEPPTAMIPLPEGVSVTPGQLRDLQASVNEAIARGCKITLLPPGSKVAAGEFWDAAL
jgi:hypothetical protein